MEPRRRLGVTHSAKEERVILQGEHLLDSRYFWNGNDCFAFTIQSKTPDLRGAAEQIACIKRIGRGNDLLDDRFPSRHDLSRAEFMKINLLIKIQIGFGPLTLSWKTRVIDSSAVRVPGRAATRCGILHVGNHVRERFACRGF